MHFTCVTAKISDVVHIWAENRQKCCLQGSPSPDIFDTIKSGVCICRAIIHIFSSSWLGAADLLSSAGTLSQRDATTKPLVQRPTDYERRFKQNGRRLQITGHNLRWCPSKVIPHSIHHHLQSQLSICTTYDVQRTLLQLLL